MSDPSIRESHEADAAFVERLFSRYREPMRRYFYKQVQNWTEAEDLTQELFVRMVRCEDITRIEKSPEPFLFQAAVNILRDRSRRRSTSNNFLAEFRNASSENYEVLSPERVLEGKQSLQAVMEALSKVDGRSKNIFILHRLEGLKYVEIAQLYGVSVSLVEKSIFKCSILVAKHMGQIRG